MIGEKVRLREQVHDQRDALLARSDERCIEVEVDHRVVVDHAEDVEEVLRSEVVRREVEDPDVEVRLEPIGLVPTPAERPLVTDQCGHRHQRQRNGDADCQEAPFS